MDVTDSVKKTFTSQLTLFNFLRPYTMEIQYMDIVDCRRYYAKYNIKLVD
jgi:hypothetical protein